MNKCIDCGVQILPKSKRCMKCYKKYLKEKRDNFVCKDCGEHSENYAKGLCKKCYMNRRHATPEWKKYHRENERQRRAQMPEVYQEYERRRRKTKRYQERTRRYNYEYYRKNREHLKAYARRYRRADRERQRVYMERKRARKAGAPGEISPDEWQQLLEQHNHSCAYCGITDVDLEMDHVVPLSRGGHNSADNIVPACANCNRSKKAMTAEEYAEFLDDVGA